MHFCCTKKRLEQELLFRLKRPTSRDLVVEGKYSSTTTRLARSSSLIERQSWRARGEPLNAEHLHFVASLFDSLHIPESMAILANSTFGLCADGLVSSYPTQVRVTRARMTGFMVLRRALLQVGETFSVQVLNVRRIKHNPVSPFAVNNSDQSNAQNACLFAYSPSKLKAGPLCLACIYGPDQLKSFSHFERPCSAHSLISHSLERLFLRRVAVQNASEPSQEFALCYRPSPGCAHASGSFLKFLIR